MFIEIVNIFSAYLLVSLSFRLLLQLLPSSISHAFDWIAELRLKVSTAVMSVYRTENNFEVALLAVIFLPFALLFVIFFLLQYFVYFYTNYVYLNILLIILLVFLISFLAPTKAEMQFFRDIDSLSIFIFVAKIFLVLQLMATSPSYDIVSVSILIVPITPVLQSI